MLEETRKITIYCVRLSLSRKLKSVNFFKQHTEEKNINAYGASKN